MHGYGIVGYSCHPRMSRCRDRYAPAEVGSYAGHLVHEHVFQNRLHETVQELALGFAAKLYGGRTNTVMLNFNRQHL